MKGDIFKLHKKGISLLRKNILFKTLAVYFLITFIIIYTLTAVQMNYSGEKLKRKIFDSHISGLKTMQVYSDTNIVQKVNDILISLQVDTGRNVAIRNFVNAKAPLNEREIYSTYTELVQSAIEKSIVFSIDIYNKNCDMLISSSSGVSYNVDDSLYEPFLYDERGPMWTQEDEAYISVINTFPLYLSAEKKCAVGIVRLNKGAVSSFLKQQIDEESGINFFVCDKNYNIISGTNEELLKAGLEEYEVQDNQNAEISVNGEKYQVFSTASAYGDWKYIYTISNSIYEKEISDLKTVSFWNVLSMMFLCFCVLVFITKWLYRPIKELMNSLKKHFKNEQEVSDISYISEEIKHLIRQVDNESAIVKQNEPLIIGHLIMETVYGNIESADMHNRLCAMDISCDNTKIVPIIVNISELILKQMDVKQQSYLCYKISEILEASTGSKARCIATKISYNNVAAFVLSDTQAADVAKRVQEGVRLFGFEEINIIIGNAEGDAGELGRMCREMLELTKYSFVYGFANIFELNTLRTREQNTGRSEREVSDLFEGLLKNNDMKSAEEFVSNLYRECERKNYSCDCIQKYFFDILCALARFEKGNDGVSKMAEGELSDMHLIYEYICQAFEELSGEEKPSEQHEEFVKRVQEFILENVQNDISQGRVAAEFNVSTAHLSRIFRKITGKKFSDFTTEAKLFAAAKMLKENSGMTVARVAESFGYYNINYFNTLFKKQFFMTPSQYRKSTLD